MKKTYIFLSLVMLLVFVISFVISNVLAENSELYMETISVGEINCVTLKYTPPDTETGTDTWEKIQESIHYNGLVLLYGGGDYHTPEENTYVKRCYFDIKGIKKQVDDYKIQKGNYPSIKIKFSEVQEQATKIGEDLSPSWLNEYKYGIIEPGELSEKDWENPFESAWLYELDPGTLIKEISFHTSEMKFTVQDFPIDLLQGIWTGSEAEHDITKLVLDAIGDEEKNIKPNPNLWQYDKEKGIDTLRLWWIFNKEKEIKNDEYLRVVASNPSIVFEEADYAPPSIEIALEKKEEGVVFSGIIDPNGASNGVLSANVIISKFNENEDEKVEMWKGILSCVSRSPCEVNKLISSTEINFGYIIEAEAIPFNGRYGEPKITRLVMPEVDVYLEPLEISLAADMSIGLATGLHMVTGKSFMVFAPIRYKLSYGKDNIKGIKAKIEITDKKGEVIYSDESEPQTFSQEYKGNSELRCEDGFVFEVVGGIKSPQSYNKPEEYKINVELIIPDNILDKNQQNNNKYLYFKNHKAHDLNLYYISASYFGEAGDLQMIDNENKFLNMMYPIADNGLNVYVENRGWLNTVKKIKNGEVYFYRLFTMVRYVKNAGISYYKGMKKNYDGKTDKFIGLVPPTYATAVGGEEWCGGGYPSLVPNSALVNLNDGGCQASVSHEVGHMFGLWAGFVEEYTMYKSTGGKQIKDTYIYRPFFNLPLGSKCQFTIGTNTPICFMGAVPSFDYNYIDEDDYRTLFIEFTEDPADPNLLFIQGIIHEDDSVSLDSWYPLGDGVPDQFPDDLGGDYSIEVIGNENSVLNKINFDIDFSKYEDNNYDDNYNENGAVFSFVIEFPLEAEKVVFKHNGELIREVIKSHNAPTVKITALNNNNIKWIAKDEDKDKLSYLIYIFDEQGEIVFSNYDNDITDMINIVAGKSGINIGSYEPQYQDKKQEQLELSDGHYTLKIIASDNFNEGEDIKSFVVRNSRIIPGKGLNINEE